MVFYINSKKVRYNPYHMKKDLKLGEGLEVEVYKINNKAVKFFKQSPGKDILISKKLIEKMKNIKTNRILLPTEPLLDKHHNIRGYQMDYIKNLGMDNYFNLDKNKLSKENQLLKEDVEILSDNKILMEDLNDRNTIYHNGLYLVDPGSYQFDPSINLEQAYGINMDKINEYLIYDLIRNYHLIKYNKFNKYASFAFCKEINSEYLESGKKDVIEFLSNIEENNLSEFIERRVRCKK